MIDFALFEFWIASLSSAMAGLELVLPVAGVVADGTACWPILYEPEHTKTNVGRNNLIQFAG
jgi:hypothetical protein